MKRLLAVLVVGFVFLGGSLPRDVYVDERTSTEIVFSVQERVFPPHWYGRRIQAEVAPLSPGERMRMVRILQRAFDKYPDQVLRENLGKVYLFKSMKFYGLPYGGTNASTNIFMSNDEENPVFSDLFIENVFHHEFSSILKRAYPWRLKDVTWRSANPADFTYGNGGARAMMNGEASMELDPTLFERGFLCRYSQASAEEDINVFAQYLFTGTRRFWAIVDRYPRLRQKADLLIHFYNSIEPQFTEAYFRTLNERIVKGS